MVWRLFLFLIVVFALSYLWARLSVRNISARSEVPAEHCQVGESFEEEFHLENSGRIPVAVAETDEFTDMPGYRDTRTFSLPSHGSKLWRTVVNCTRRGCYQVGSLDITVSDPLGFFPVKQRIGQFREITVFPRTYELPHFQVIPRQEAGQSPRRWMASEAGSGASRVREYGSGDSLRHVHWPTTAHSGRLMVKEFDPERSNYAFRSVWIIPDMYGPDRYGSGEETTEEYTVTTAASLVRKYIRGGKEVGLIATGSRSVLHLPETGQAHEERILRSLATLRSAGRVPVPSLLAAEVDRFEAGSAVVVIVPSGAGDIVTPLRRAINRGSLITVVLLDTLSFGGETPAGAEVRFLETAGVNVYTVHRGEHISGALDSRFLSDGVTSIGLGVM